jgi:hypothetical protein
MRSPQREFLRVDNDHFDVTVCCTWDWTRRRERSYPRIENQRMRYWQSLRSCRRRVREEGELQIAPVVSSAAMSSDQRKKDFGLTIVAPPKECPTTCTRSKLTFPAKKVQSMSLPSMVYMEPRFPFITSSLSALYA